MSEPYHFRMYGDEEASSSSRPLTRLRTLDEWVNDDEPLAHHQGGSGESPRGSREGRRKRKLPRSRKRSAITLSKASGSSGREQENAATSFLPS